MAYPVYYPSGQLQPTVQPVAQPAPGQAAYSYPQPPQGQLEQLRAAQVYQAQAAAQQAAQQAAQAAQAAQAPQMGFQWVQGEAGAKAFLVAPGASVLLMDSEGQSFYIKAADGTGMPLPLRIFDYQERQAQQQAAPQVAQQAPQAAPEPPVDYVTHEELGALLRRLEELEKAKPAPAEKSEDPATEKEKGGTRHGKRDLSAAQQTA